MWAWLTSLDPIVQAAIFATIGVALGKIFDVWIARSAREQSSEDDFSGVLADLRSERRLRRDIEKECRTLHDRMKLVDLRADNAEAEVARIRIDRTRRLRARRRALKRMKRLARHYRNDDYSDRLRREVTALRAALEAARRGR
jgi:hypothetical protein